MFGRRRSELQGLEGMDQSSNVWKDKNRTIMFGRIGLTFQCLKGKDQNSSV